MSNMYKILFSTTLIMGTIMAVSSYSWMGMWMGLEINLLSIIPLMNNSNNIMSSESSLKYFITQVVASTTLLFSMILISSYEMMNIDEFKTPLMNIMNSSLLMKMGAAPLHFWFPEIIEGLSWMNCLVMLTWQKIAPMIILLNNMKNIQMIQAVIVMSMLIGGIMGLNQTSMRKILVYSSINHIGWMLATMLINFSVWMNYMMIYMIMSTSLIMLLKKFNMSHMNQIFSTKNNLLKTSILMNFLSMGGVPPFLGFMPKWLAINKLIENHITLALTMVLITLITLFYYVRTVIPSMTLTNNELSISSTKQGKFLIWWTNWINMLALMLMTMPFNLT